MRKFFWIILLATPLACFSQGFNGGVILGGLISQVDGDTWRGYDKFGFLGGGYVYLKLSEHSAVQMEMQYIQKGSRHNIDQDNPLDQSYLMRLNYFEMPLLFRYTFGKKYVVEAGPALDVLISALEEQEGIENPPTEPFRDVCLAGILGVGYNITDHLQANFRLNYSLISIRDASAPYPASYRQILGQYGQFNNVLSLSLLWDFKSRDF